MTHAKQRALTWLLVLVLAFSLLPGFHAASADETGEGPRDTEFFTPQAHTDLDYSDIVYTHIDPAELIAEVDALRELLGDGENTEEFRTRFLALADQMDRQDAMYYILTNMHYANSKDLWAALELETVYEETLETQDAFSALVRDALSSPCASAFDGLLTEGQKAGYLYYEEMSDELKALFAQDTALQSEYMSKVVDDYSAEFGGRVYDAYSAEEDYYGGELTYDEYFEISKAIAKNKNAVLGEIFVRMVEVRNRIAELQGCESYADYAYRYTYSRDYTPGEAQEFCDAVKTSIVPLFQAMDSSVHAPLEEQMPEDIAYTGAGMFDTLLPCFAQLSDELLESAKYTYDHGAYDVDPGPNKTSTGYSLILPHYNMPYYYLNPYGDWTDLCSTIHEMGHNNEAYWHPEAWNTLPLCYDTAEVHSQGLEMLMLPFYPELFGEQADTVRANTILSMLYSIVSGAEYDEFQRRVYALPELTLEAVNRTYRQIAEEYGFVSADDERTELYGWVEVPHSFTDPMYYISYATSAAGAFAFWEAAQTDWLAAVDDYLRFTAISREQGFAETFRAIGMESPMSEEYLQGLAETISARALGVGPFTDVRMDDWFGDCVSYVYYFGMMNGVSEDRFDPNGFATRAQLMTVLARSTDAASNHIASELTLEDGVAWAMENGISDGSDLAGVLTREQLATMFYRFAQFLGVDVSMGEDTNILSYEDAFDISGWAMPAMQWACAVGLLEDTSLGRIAPQGEITRAYLAQMLQYFWWYVY